MTAMEVVLVSLLGTVVVLTLVGTFFLVRGKDRALQANNCEFGHMARQFAMQLHLDDGDGLTFAELAFKTAEERAEESGKYRRLKEARRQRRLVVTDEDVTEPLTSSLGYAHDTVG